MTKTTNMQKLRGIVEKNLDGTKQQQALNYIKVIDLEIKTLSAHLAIKNEIIQTKSQQIMELNERFLGKKFDTKKMLRDSSKGIKILKGMRKKQWMNHHERLQDLRGQLEEAISECEKNL